MPAFPFPPKTPSLTFRQFAELLSRQNLAIVARIVDPESETGTDALYRFTRISNGAFIADVIEYVEDDTWQMMPSTFRSLCIRLRLDPGIVGGSAH